MNEILQKRIEEAVHQYIQSDAVAPENMQLAFGDFINGAKWALQNQWISVEEALPEIKEHFVSEDVICKYSDDTMGFSRLKENLFGQKWFEYEDEDSHVTHWMEIPKLNSNE